jgi:hypothetical protein
MLPDNQQIELPIDEYYSDSAIITRYLKQAELLLAEAVSFSRKMKQLDPMRYSQLATDTADAWHYIQEALGEIES